MSMEPKTLRSIEQAGAIRALVMLLGRRLSPFFKDVENLVLQCLFYLCRVSRRRQEQAAKHGIVPHLQK